MKHCAQYMAHHSCGVSEVTALMPVLIIWFRSSSVQYSTVALNLVCQYVKIHPTRISRPSYSDKPFSSHLDKVQMYWLSIDRTAGSEWLPYCKLVLARCEWFLVTASVCSQSATLLTKLVHNVTLCQQELDCENHLLLFTVKNIQCLFAFVSFLLLLQTFSCFDWSYFRSVNPICYKSYPSHFLFFFNRGKTVNLHQLSVGSIAQIAATDLIISVEKKSDSVKGTHVISLAT